MTTYVQSSNAKQQFFTDAGALAVGYLLYTYAATTSTPATTYQASTGGANTNPITLDARGEADIWLDPALSYKYVLKTAAGATVWTVDNVGATSLAAGSITTAALSTEVLQIIAVKNRLTNPNWAIDQINEGALYTYSSTAAVGPDGWSGSATGAGVFKVRTLADPDNSTLRCLEITCTTADASLAATDNYFIYTNVEGYDAAPLHAGLATAKAIAIQFKFKTTATGVYGVSIANSATNRSYVGTITVADTNENAYLVTLTLDTTGTWLYTNGVGLYLRLSLAAGSNFCTTAGSWAANNMFSQTASQATFMALNTHTAYLKRIQLFAGSTAQEYTSDYAHELQQCQRYYCKTFSQGIAPEQASADGANGPLISYGIAASAGPSAKFEFPVSMRDVPTITTYNPTSANANWDNDSSGSDSTAQVRGIATTGASIAASTSPATGTLTLHVTANARLT